MDPRHPLGPVGEDATVTEEPSSLGEGIGEHHAENPFVGEFGVDPLKGS
jgi:hypothetical protein